MKGRQLDTMGRELDREALLRLAEHALPQDAPGAWIRRAVAQVLSAEDMDADTDGK